MVFESIEIYLPYSEKFNLTFQSCLEAMPQWSPMFQARLPIRAPGRMECL